MPKHEKKSPKPTKSPESTKPDEVVIPSVPLAPGDKLQPMGPVSSEELGKLLARVGAQMAQDNPHLPYRVRYLECQTDAELKAVLREYIKKFPAPGQRNTWLQERIEENGLQHYIPAATDGKPPWYESSPDVLRRRQIVLRNPGFSAESLCKVFDSDDVPLNPKWKEKFGMATWVDAYKNESVRPLIQKMISDDKTHGA